MIEVLLHSGTGLHSENLITEVDALQAGAVAPFSAALFAVLAAVCHIELVVYDTSSPDPGAPQRYSSDSVIGDARLTLICDGMICYACCMGCADCSPPSPRGSASHQSSSTHRSNPSYPSSYTPSFDPYTPYSRV